MQDQIADYGGWGDTPSVDGTGARLQQPMNQPARVLLPVANDDDDCQRHATVQLLLPGDGWFACPVVTSAAAAGCDQYYQSRSSREPDDQLLDGGRSLPPGMTRYVVYGRLQDFARVLSRVEGRTSRRRF
jgi:hypothetical protein